MKSVYEPEKQLIERIVEPQDKGVKTVFEPAKQEIYDELLEHIVETQDKGDVLAFRRKREESISTLGKASVFGGEFPRFVEEHGNFDLYIKFLIMTESSYLLIQDANHPEAVDAIINYMHLSVGKDFTVLLVSLVGRYGRTDQIRALIDRLAAGAEQIERAYLEPQQQQLPLGVA